MAIVLASASPRRAELLRAAGFAFDVRPVDVDESRAPDEAPDGYVLRVAMEKAHAARARQSGDVIVAADTTVALGDPDAEQFLEPRVVLGKPANAADAAWMLRQLSGRVHEVLTGVVVTSGERDIRFVDSTRVWFAPLTEEDIAWYVASGEPMDKAGAYAIQGLASRFIPRIEGSYTNVVGLPIARVGAALRELMNGR
jgi:septum formation protein